jgi:hypothetical protein
MATAYNPAVVTDGLIFCSDMSNKNKSWIGRPTTNSINASTAVIGRYNNPGITGANTNTGLTYKGMPIYELTFVPQDASYISRMGSTEGFGAFHTMTIPLQTNTRYMASIYFKSDWPLQNSATQGFSNGYSNITGWNQNNTTSARYEDDGWIRLYTQNYNNTNGYSARTSGFQVNFTVNTTSTQNVDLTFTVPANGAGISDFAYLYAIVSANPAIASNGGLTGLSIVNHGLDTTNFEKMSWPSVIKLKASDLPFNYYVRLSVPSTGGSNVTIALRANFLGYHTALSDSKYWKVTFDTTNLQVGQTIRTYWCCPMLEQHDTVYPSTFVNGTRSSTQGLLDITNNTSINVNNLSYNTDGTYSFDGTDDYLTITPNTNYQFSNNQPFSIAAWVKCNNTSGVGNILAFSNGGAGYYLTLDKSFLRTNSFLFDYYDGSAFRGIQGNNNSITMGSWVYIVATSSSNSVNDMKLYQNGVLTSYTNRGTGTPNSINYTGLNLQIGARGGSGCFQGDIANLTIYNKALTETEIKQNFNALRSKYGI